MARSAALFTAVALTLFACVVTQAVAVPAPRGTQTVTPTPSPTPPDDPVTNTCCFCVYPDRGRTDHQSFQQTCERCVGTTFTGCTVTAAFAEGDFTPEAIKPFNCQGTINHMNLNHGPNGSYVSSQVRVCQSAYPTCSINFNDLSCLTFRDQDEARTFIGQVQERLQKPVTVQLCGSRSVNLMNGCDAMRQTTKYSISPTEVRGDLGPCPAPGTLCSVDVGFSNQRTYQCRESGVIWNQECCLLTSQGKPNPNDVTQNGVWGPLGGGCLFNGCDEESCPLTTTCSGTRLSTQACIEVEGSTGRAKVCKQVTSDCAHLAMQCVHEGGGRAKCGEECDPEKCPTRSWCQGDAVVKQECSKPENSTQGAPSCEKTYQHCDRDAKRECRVEDGLAACRGIPCNPQTCPKNPTCVSSKRGTEQYCDDSEDPPRCVTAHMYCDKGTQCVVLDGDLQCVAQPTPTRTAGPSSTRAS